MELIGKDIDRRDGYVYDVAIKGLDANFWANVSGTPTVSNGTILVNAAKMSSFILHEYSDAEFLLTVPAVPTSGDVRQFGFYAPSSSAFGAVYFKTAGTVFSANVVDNYGNVSSITIPWQSAWTATPTPFRVIWGQDRIQFFAGVITNGVNVPTLLATFASPQTGLPLSALPITIANGNSDNLALTYLCVRRSAGIV